VLDPGREIAFPDSVVQMMRGDLGQPPGGWPPALQKKVLKGATPIAVRPGSLLAPADIEAERASVAAKTGGPVDDRALASYLMYPKVHADFVKAAETYGPVSVLPTPVFFYGLAPGEEILVEIRVPAWPSRTGGSYMKFPHPASRFAIVGVGAVVTLDKDGKCTKAGVGVTGAGTKAVRAKGVEAGLVGKKLDAATIEAAAQKAADGIDVQADLQGSVEYKAHLCRVFAKRAITEAVKRAGA
jgi:hypothetical protein